MEQTDDFILENNGEAIGNRPAITEGIYAALVSNSTYARAVAGLPVEPHAPAVLPAESINHVLLALHHRSLHDDACALGKLADWCNKYREKHSLPYNWTIKRLSNS